MADNYRDISIPNFCEKAKELHKGNIRDLNFLLDELNSLDYQTLPCTNDEAEDLLQSILPLIPERNDHITSKVCSLLIFLSHKFKGIEFSEECVETLFEFVLKAAQTCSPWVQSDVLFALSCLLYKNLKIPKQIASELLSPRSFLLFSASASNEPNVQYAAFKCLQSLTSRFREECEEEFMKNVFTVCISSLESNISYTENANNCKILIFSLRCIENVFSSKIGSVDQLGELLGLIKALLYCGFPGQPVVSAVHLYPTLINLYTPDHRQNLDEDTDAKRLQKRKAHRIRPRKKNAGKSQTDKKKNSDAEDGSNTSECGGSLTSFSKISDTLSERKELGLTSSSESDFSDLEDNGLKIKQLHTSMRQHAYSALQAIMKATDKKTMFGYWSSFLPHCASADSGTNSLNIFTTILKDPSPKVRLCAVGVLSEVLHGSKPYLSLVDDRPISTQSFISASSVLTSLVNELHRNLLLALVSETSHSLLTQILKCYAVLVENVPYKRLKSDLLIRPVKHLKHLLHHKDVQVQVACLTVFGAMLNSDHVPEEIVKQLISSSGPVIQESASSHENTVNNNLAAGDSSALLPWIVSVCKENILNKNLNQPLPVVVESLQVLAVISGKYFNVIKPIMPVMEQIIQACFQDAHCFLQLHGAKLLEVIGRAILSELNEKVGDSAAIEMAFRFWSKIFSEKFPSCLVKSEQDTSRTVCCDCLSTVPPLVFSKLPKVIQFYCISLIFGFSCETDHNVRGAAVRCIGIYALFPFFQQCFSFFDDSARILSDAVKDDSVIVRVKASWALGNLTDALLAIRNESLEHLREVSPEFLYSLGMAAVHASEDCDRIRASGVRALGNLLHFLPSNFLEFPQIREFVGKAQSALLSGLSAKVMKVCWNACYALKNVFQNKELISSSLFHVAEALEHLMHVLKCHNFKVRINGVIALSALPSREAYGEQFSAVFSQLIYAVTAAEADVDFKELKHFEALHDAVCLSLCHLLRLVIEDDLSVLNKHSFDAGEILLTSMWKFGQNAGAEKISIVCEAIDHLVELISQSLDSPVLELWKDILTQAKTAFHQSHDAFSL